MALLGIDGSLHRKAADVQATKLGWYYCITKGFDSTSSSHFDTVSEIAAYMHNTHRPSLVPCIKRHALQDNSIEHALLANTVSMV